MFMSHLGIVLLIWMGTGLIAGLKGFIFDDPFSEDNIENTRKFMEERGRDSDLSVLRDKKLYFVYSILLGPIGILADLYGSIKYGYSDEEEEDEQDK